jgi:hypothetical protein
MRVSMVDIWETGRRHYPTIAGKDDGTYLGSLPSYLVCV